MRTKRIALIWILTFKLLAEQKGWGQTAAARAMTPETPTVTVSTAATGAAIQSLGAGNSSLNLGSVSYYRGASAAGTTTQKRSGVLVITTHFRLRVDCPGSPASAQVSVSVSRLGAASSHTLVIDGTPLGTTAQILVSSMLCGSSAEHRLDTEVPVTTPAGSIGSTVAFAATLKN